MLAYNAGLFLASADYGILRKIPWGPLYHRSCTYQQMQAQLMPVGYA